MRIAFAVFLFIHAAAHGVGFLSQSGIVAVEDAGGPPSLLFSDLPRGGRALRILSIIWLAALGGLVLAGIGVLNQSSWAVPVTIAATAFSTVICILWYKDVPFGIVANVLVVLALAIPPIADRIFPIPG
jgi:hypothetical protein